MEDPRMPGCWNPVTGNAWTSPLNMGLRVSRSAASPQESTDTRFRKHLKLHSRRSGHGWTAIRRQTYRYSSAVSRPRNTGHTSSWNQLCIQRAIRNNRNMFQVFLMHAYCFSVTLYNLNYVVGNSTQETTQVNT